MVAIRYEKTHASKQKLSLHVCLCNACACPRHEKGGNVREEEVKEEEGSTRREKSVHTSSTFILIFSRGPSGGSYM